jgi:hypothetical protein
MADIVSYRGDTGLLALVNALHNLRRMLLAGTVDADQAAGYLGCINLHLARTLGMRGDLLEELQSCAGLLCPECKGFVGFISNLSGSCHLCGAPLFDEAEGA